MEEDSLENFQPRRKSVSPSAKDEKQRAMFQQLKHRFVVALSKLQSSETREIGIREIREMIDRNREPEHIRLFISLMKSLKIQGTSSSTREHQVLVFSIMAEILRRNLVDPVDKPAPSAVKTCFRVVEILHSYFTDTSGTVQQACARVLIDLGKYVLGAQSADSSIDVGTFITILFAPLASILKNGVDKASQSTASVCINEQVQYWKAQMATFPIYQQALDRISPQMLAVALKLNCEYQQTFMALSVLIQLKGLQFFEVEGRSRLHQFVGKILGVISKTPQNPSTTPDTMNNLNAYMCKVNVCRILENIGRLLMDRKDIKDKLGQLCIPEALQKAARNRVIQVQMAANRAIRIWNGEAVSPLKEVKRPSTASRAQQQPILSLEEARNMKKRERSGSKEDQAAMQKKLNHIKQDLGKLVKGGWGAHNRANNFVKKNSGVGGGHRQVEELASPGKSPGKSHKEHIQQLRKFIKQSSKSHSSKQKFVFYQEKTKGERNQEQQHVAHTHLAESKSKKDAGVEKIGTKMAKQDSFPEEQQFVLAQQSGQQMVNMNPQRKVSNPYVQVSANGQIQPQATQDIDDVDSDDLNEAIDDEQIRQLMQEAKDTQAVANLNIQSRKKVEQEQPRAKPQSKINPDDYKNKNTVWADPKAATKENMSKNPTVNTSSFNANNTSSFNSNNEAAVAEKGESFSKPTNPLIRINEGLNQSQVSQSVDIADIMNQSDFQGFEWNPYTAKDSTANLGFTKKQQPQESVGKDSLVLSLSRSQKPYSSMMSKKSPSESKNQFTLNPKAQNPSNFSKFDSHAILQESRDDEIEEILDESNYEQSVPHRLEPRAGKQFQAKNQKVQSFYRKTVEHGQELDKKASKLGTGSQDNRSEVYQEMIRNPPRSLLPHRLDKPEQLTSEPSVTHPQEQEAIAGENITETWRRVLELVQSNEINEAYTITLDMDDPVYLLRLMLATQVPLKKLTPANTRRLWEKFLNIYQHRFIDNIFVQMFSTANKVSGGKGISRSLSIEEVNDLLIELYELSGRTKGKLSFGAATLYNEVDALVNGHEG